MRLLVDENCDISVVKTLRAAGHDVVAVAEISPRAEDSLVVEMALRDDRVVVTEDKDFGQLVFAAGRGSAGVLLLRYPARMRKILATEVARIAEEYGPRLLGGFAVASPGRLRISRLPNL